MIGEHLESYSVARLEFEFSCSCKSPCRIVRSALEECPSFSTPENAALHHQDQFSISLSPEFPPPNDYTTLFASPGGFTWKGCGRKYSITKRASDGEDVWTLLFDLDSNAGAVYHHNRVAGKEDETILLTSYAKPVMKVLLPYLLSERQGAMHHCAGCIINNHGLIFPGPSNVGKSTLSAILDNHKCFTMIGDDLVVTRRIDECIHAFGTPWHSDAGISRNLHASLGAILFLHQAPENRLERIPAKAAIDKILAQTDIPWYNSLVMANILDYCNELITTVPTYNLFFKPDRDVADLLEQFANEL